MKQKKDKNELKYERKNFWKEASKSDQKAAMDYSVAYKQFLNEAKTEREATKWMENMLKKHKFTDIYGKKGNNKVYGIFRGKTMAIAVLGSEPISRGFNMVASHIDAPRVDLKQNPLYEDGQSQMACMRTHYYGGIKKYQWVSTPLDIS